MRAGTLSCALLALVAVAGCKSSDANGDASPTPCGDAVCPAGVLCVSKQSCGPLTCDAVPDGGVCPPGTSATPSCPDAGRPGCYAGCPEAQFSCENRPSGCNALSCACAASLCAPGTCIATMGARVACDTP